MISDTIFKAYQKSRASAIGKFSKPAIVLIDFAPKMSAKRRSQSAAATLGVCAVLVVAVMMMVVVAVFVIVFVIVMVVIMAAA